MMRRVFARPSVASHPRSGKTAAGKARRANNYADIRIGG